MSTPKRDLARSRTALNVGRPKKYTHAAILDAAIRVAQGTGLDALTMQNVSTALSTSPATLYRYYDSRESLLGAIVERLAAEFDIPGPPSDNASATERSAWLTELVNLTRDGLLSVRGAADYVLLTGPTGPAGLQYMGTVCSVIAQTGRSPQQVAHAYDLLLTTVSAYTSKIERLELAGGSQQMATSLTALYEAVGDDPALGMVLAELTSDAGNSFERATGQIIDWIVSPSTFDSDV